MEYRLYLQMYEIVVTLSKSQTCKGKRFSNAWIVLTLLWSILHDRPISWACDPENWPKEEAWHAIPSNSTMSRRLRTVPVQTLMVQVESHVRDLFPKGLFKMIDAKPLPVGGASGDPDVDCGRGARGKAVGYKFHAVWDMGRVVDHWQIASMSTNEKTIASRLIPNMKDFIYLAADNQYDANHLFDATARGNGQLVTAPRTKVPAGIGHRKQSEHRLRSLEMTKNPLAACGAQASFGQQLIHQRDEVERCFGTLGNFACGMGPLPNWIRRPWRVVRWVWAKLLTYHVRLALKQGLIA